MHPTIKIAILATILHQTFGQDSSIYSRVQRLYDGCLSKEDVYKCFKIQMLKVVERAANSKKLTLSDYISIVKDNTSKSENFFNESKLEGLPSDQIDDLIYQTTGRFLDTHRFQVEVPKLIDEGRRKGGNKGGGGGGGGHGNGGALLWALAIKGTFLAMAYKGIAIMSGTALIVGKMALMLAAILGLKKLVSSGHEKTTVEIIKQPKYSESHVHSSSHEDEGGYYKRMYVDENSPQSMAYRFYDKE